VNHRLLLLAFPALLAAAPTPLVVGSVRDQRGLPIAGARVSTGDASAQTDSQGTFALEAANVDRIKVACAYCKTRTIAVTPDEPVVVIVQRYDALVQDAPAPRDVASVPYSRAESIAALQPFTVLENSSHALPGPQISDRGASSRGALVFGNGLPMYDVASNQSPFVAFPAYSAQRISWLPPSDAFTYGDLAGGGTVIADTQGEDPWGGIAVAGSTSAVRAGQTLANAAWSGADSSDSSDRRARGDAFARFPLGDDTFDVSAVTAEDRYSYDGQHLNTSDSGVRLDYTSVRQNRVTASVFADGGGYDGSTPTIQYWSKWSDIQAQGGVATTTRIQFFTDAAVNASSGDYRASGSALPLTAGAIAQTRIDMGAQTAGDRYSVKVGAGAFGMHYAGGSAGARLKLDGGLVAPSFSGSYALDPHWTLELQGGETFRLPTILEAFVYPPDGPGLVLDRNEFLSETLHYSDLGRFRASATALSERVNGLDRGTIHSAGVSAAWQIAPAFSLRAWLLRDNDLTQPYEAVYRFGARPQPATVSSYWLTYESSGLRVDAIYRRDLIDYRADPHFDASVSAPLTPVWRIYGATERIAGTRTFSIGLRAQTP
jgi:hypothetical protein